VNRVHQTGLVPSALLACVCLGWHGDTAVAAAFGALVIGASLFGRRMELDVIGQIIWTLIAAAVSYAWHFSINEPPRYMLPGRLGAIAQTVSFFFILSAAVRLHIANPRFCATGTAGLLLFAWLFLGAGNLGPSYALFAIPGIVATIAGYRFTWTDRLPLRDLPADRRLLAGVTWLIAALTAAVILLGQPILYRRAIDRYYSSLWVSRTGFNTVFRLGAIRDMIQSDEVVLRLYRSTGRTTHLRGVVYANYGLGIWSVPRGDQLEEYDAGPPPGGVKTVEMRYAGGDERRYFLPLSAGRFFAEDPTVQVGPDGIVHPVNNARPQIAWFEEDGAFPWPIAAPELADTLIPGPLREPLGALSARWTAGASTTGQKLSNLTRHLRSGYRYSLSFERRLPVDPIEEFLFHQKEGHCEYFATALALLARAQGIPTRVVGGYRVSEYNDAGNYHIVRQRNAHTWVEAWVEGRGWVTVDPTPPGPLEYEPSMVTSLLDLVPAYAEKGLEAFAAMSALQLGGIVGALVGIWMLVRLVRRVRRRVVVRGSEADYRAPEAAFVRLMATLEKCGFTRAGGETLEHFANRVAGTRREGVDAAVLIREYGVWRYGRRGDMAAIANRMHRWVDAKDY